MNIARACVEVIPFINLILTAYDHDNNWFSLTPITERLLPYLPYNAVGVSESSSIPSAPQVSPPNAALKNNS
jgi:hypothetical protein